MLFDRKPTEDSNHICKLFAINGFISLQFGLVHFAADLLNNTMFQDAAE